MSRWRNNGGWNKRCGTIEKTPRIDSYEAGAVVGWGHLFGHTGKGFPLTLECEHFIDYGPETDREIVELCHPKQGWTETLELSRKANGYGGSQAFFLCPACSERRRYLYLTGTTFLCRKCAQVNYRSQRRPVQPVQQGHHHDPVRPQRMRKAPILNALTKQQDRSPTTTRRGSGTVYTRPPPEIKEEIHGIRESFGNV